LRRHRQLTLIRSYTFVLWQFSGCHRLCIPDRARCKGAWSDLDLGMERLLESSSQGVRVQLADETAHDLP
jgi:hypothetical protein